MLLRKLFVAPTCCLVLAAAACGGPTSEPAQPQENVATPSSSGAGGTSTPGASPSTAEASPKSTPARPRSGAVVAARDFTPARFTDPTRVTNPYYPLEPGLQWVWKGHAYDDDDEKVSRQITMTITDLTKEVNGVRTIVGWDQDATDGETEEVELTFHAQDDAGAVWYFGEYSEEYDGKKIVKTPTWLGGIHGARPGVMMQPVPRLRTPAYEEGWGGTKVNWTDRGKVDQVGHTDCLTKTRCYRNVVVIDEFNPDEPGTHQLKSYAPNVGGIRTGWRGAKEVEKEELELVAHRRLSADELDGVRRAVLAQEKRAYARSKDVYAKTRPMTKR